MIFNANWHEHLCRSLCMALFGLSFTPFSASASIPSGKSYGSWQVTSISSVSGDGASNDPMVILSQESGANRFELSWFNGDVISSIDIEECDEADFEQSYSVSLKRWLAMSNSALVARLSADLSVWYSQAKFACSSQGEGRPFDLDEIKPAVEDFTRRIRYFAPAQGSKN